MQSNDKYVLEIDGNIKSLGSEGYYTGKNYIYQGSKYAVVDKDIKKAKIYSSQATANKACNMMFENYLFIAVRL